MAWGLFSLWGAATLVFLLARALPGDPVDAMLGENAPAVRKSELRASLHLDEPLPVQYGRFLAGAGGGRLGTSLRTGRPVAVELAEAFPFTLRLGLMALLLACVVGLPLGGLAARSPGSTADSFSRFMSTAGLALPSFFLGPLLLLAFAVLVPLFPISGADEPGAVVLPAITLALPLAGVLGRVGRASLLAESGRDYLRTALAKGISVRRAFWAHAGKNALPPVLTTVGMQFGALLTGAVLAEKVFRWPGLGTLVLTSIGSRDYPAVQGVVLLFAAVYVAANLLADVACAWVDSRIRL
jgi:peptide/nickel transport system permease protein